MGDRDGSDVAAIRDRVADHVAQFVRDLRRAGADVPANAGIDATRALVVVGFDDYWRARAALRATLLTRREDIATLDRLFPRFWDCLLDTDAGGPDRSPGTADPESRPDDGPRRTPSETDPDGDAGEESRADPPEAADAPDPASDRPGDRSEPSTGGGAGDDPTVGPGGSAGAGRSAVADDGGGDGGERAETAVYSRVGRSEPVDVPLIGDDDGVSEATRDLGRSLADLRGRRWAPTASGSRIDARRALRRGFSTGGAVTEVPRRARRTTGVRAVFLVDVSRSVLDTIDRDFLVRFLRTAYDEWRDVRVFFFDTGLREVTAQFAAPSTGAVVAALRRAETTWGGGTRIGHAIGSLRRADPQCVERRTSVFVISDGLEVGETAELERGMAWLARRASAVLWLNPLAASPGYEPTCRGMAASLPYVDGLFAFAGPDDVAEIARQLRLRGPGARIGYRYDPRLATHSATDE